ncbi:annexin A9 [Terrapene carolina triunguis]|uniref:annexin A9 n=1 Tax=Terrapene triunguis TaxID=2587831 RepID=UPI000CEF6F86|nr:annexin A9 [Terrapene carolina triunguis]
MNKFPSNATIPVCLIDSWADTPGPSAVKSRSCDELGESANTLWLELSPLASSTERDESAHPSVTLAKLDPHPLAQGKPHRREVCVSGRQLSAGKDNAMLLGDGMDRRSLAHEILSQLPLAQQTAAWGTLGTIKPYLGFDAESDVQHLVEAIAGNGADHGAILDVLTNRTSAQRQHITKGFQALTKQDLLKSMEVALSGNLEQVIMGLLKPPAQYDAHELRAAMQGIGTDEDALTEILSTRSNQQLREILIRILISRSETDLLSIRSEFKKCHGKSLYSCLQVETRGDYQAALLALCRAEDL